MTNIPSLFSSNNVKPVKENWNVTKIWVDKKLLERFIQYRTIYMTINNILKKVLYLIPSMLTGEFQQQRYAGDERLCRDQHCVSISAPSLVIKMVCSNWAERLPSSVTTVHSSSHIIGLMLPIVNIGSAEHDNTRHNFILDPSRLLYVIQVLMKK